MPSACVHMSVCKIINQKYKRSNTFLIGNIAPDCWRHSLYHSNKNKSHFINNNIEDYMQFYNKYKSSIQDDFVFGYLTHLMTDYYWKTYVLPKYVINSEEVILRTGKIYKASREKIKELMHDNNKIATYKITKHFNLALIKTDFNISCNIEEIDLSGLKKTIDYINTSNFEKPYKDLTVYKIEDLYEEIEKCSQFIIENIEKILSN